MAATANAHLYASAAVVADTNSCCAAAAKIAGKRFLTAEVPMLPLDDCDSIEGCRCKYQKFNDRRQDDRRGLANSIASNTHQGDERRTINRGRRQDD